MKNAKPAGAELRLTEAHLIEIARCANDIRYFAENYFFIITKDRGKEIIKFYPKQIEMLETMHSARFSATLASRQIGKTTLASIELLHAAMFNPDYFIGILANKEETAKEILTRIKTAYKMLPMWLKQGVMEWNKLSIVFENGSTIACEATTEDSFTGKSINILFIDEVAKIRSTLWDPFWESAYPTISSGTTTKIIMVSTPKGLNQWWRICEDARLERSTFKFFRFDWWEVPGRDEQWKNETMRSLGADAERKFAQEFGCSFLGSANTLISTDCIQRQVWREPEVQEYDHSLKIYEPFQPGHTYLAGADTGKGVDGCYSVCQILDVTAFPIKQVAILRANQMRLSDFTVYAYNLMKRYGDPLCMVENNAEGQAMVDNLFEDLEYEHVFYEGGQKKGLGLRTTVKTKRIMCLTLKELLEKDKLILCDAATIGELATFVAEGQSWEPEEGHHGDCVMALAIAVYALRTPWIRVGNNYTITIAEPPEDVVDITLLPSNMYGDEDEDEWLADLGRDDKRVDPWATIPGKDDADDKGKDEQEEPWLDGI
jgi:hypothetical protein